MYNLTFLLPAIVMFMLAPKSEERRLDWIYLAFLGLLMIPKAYYYLLYEHAIGIQVALDGLLLLGLILFYNIFDKSTRKKRVRKSKGND